MDGRICTCDEYGGLAYAVLIATILHENEHAGIPGAPGEPAKKPGKEHSLNAPPGPGGTPTGMTKAVIEQLKAMQGSIAKNKNGKPVCPCGCGQPWFSAWSDLGAAAADEQEYADNGFKKPQTTAGKRKMDGMLKHAKKNPKARGDK